jgi:VanZ family protein
MTQQTHIPFKRFWPGIIWFVVLLVLICTPGNHLPSSKFLIEISFDKMVHVGAFALLAWLFYYPVAKTDWPAAVKRHYLIKICVSTIIWGLATELIQRYFIPNRSFDMADWLADSMGAVLAFAVVKWWPVRAKS